MTNSLISLLPTFSGSSLENVSNFIFQFKEIAELERWSDAKKLVLKLQLRNFHQPRDFYQIGLMEGLIVENNFEDKIIIQKYQNLGNFREISSDHCK